MLDVHAWAADVAPAYAPRPPSVPATVSELRTGCETVTLMKGLFLGRPVHATFFWSADRCIYADNPERPVLLANSFSSLLIVRLTQAQPRLGSWVAAQATSRGGTKCHLRM